MAEIKIKVEIHKSDLKKIPLFLIETTDINFMGILFNMKGK